MGAVRRLFAATSCLAALALSLPAAAQAQADTSVTLSTSAPVPFSLQFDTPGGLFIDRDGTFHYQDGLSQYSLYDPANLDHSWRFFTGADIDEISAKGMAALEPITVRDTTGACENSPLSLQNPHVKNADGTYRSGYPYNNFCVIVGVWVDPDNGDWYGLVHEELFGGRPRYDGIEYARSRDRGKSWTILAPILTSPFPMKGIDDVADPQDPRTLGTYYYGDGDPRLLVDTASGYFYVFYFTRVQDTRGRSTHAWWQHVARAPISAKMAPNSWRKYYRGEWSEPGVQGRESNLIPVETPGDTGWSPVEYDPTKPGTAAELGYVNSPLFVLNISWNAYLGKYIGTPNQSRPPYYDNKGPLVFYAADDLATQRWTKIGPLPGYGDSDSWYRWMVEDGSGTTSRVTGKTFRSYCSVDCTTYAAEYVKVTIACASGESCAAPSPVEPGQRYRIRTAGRWSDTVDLGGHVPWRGGRDWLIEPTGDGFYRIRKPSGGLVLGVVGAGGGASTAARAWGARVGLANPASDATSPAGLSQQWSIEAVTAAGHYGDKARYRIVNRYSDLALNLSHGQLATVPLRSWDRAASADALSRPSLPVWRQRDQIFTFEPARR